jgi:formate--tetrahydrofolate ligase
MPIGTTVDTVAQKLGIPESALEPRGRHVLKVDPAQFTDAPKGRVVLVTAMTPTPAGEGKTVTTIGLTDGLNRIGVRAIGALREPSLGPLFGLKGGAVGGGRSQIIPTDSINLHFTGDLHAVTSAHNLLAAIADNHIFYRNSPTIDPARILWPRVMDMTDRALRDVEVGRGLGKSKTDIIRKTRFDITAASEVMACLCVSRDFEELQAKLDGLLVGFTADDTPVYAKDLEAGGAMAALLLEASRPNLVQTRDGNPVLVHGGPFANIAQGTSSLIQTQLARKLADVVVTEAGFAFDLGGVKFFDLKCRAGGFKPAAVVMVVTVKALRHHGGVDYKAGPNIAALTAGLENVAAHFDAMDRLGITLPVLAINRFPDDSPEELAAIKAFAEKRGTVAIEGFHFAEGGAGAEGIAREIARRLEAEPRDMPNYKGPYELTDAVPVKIEKLANTVFGATGIELTEKAQADLAVIEKLGVAGRPICVAKTHLSISDSKDALGRPAPFTLKVTGLRPSAGAGFNVALCGPILTMPGMPEVPAAANIGVERNADAIGGWDIVGLK